MSKPKKKQFSTLDASQRLMESMAIAIDNMIDEIKKPVDPEVSGGARKAELQSVKQTATDCKELLIDRERLAQMVKELKKEGYISEKADYSSGFPEEFSK